MLEGLLFVLDADFGRQVFHDYDFTTSLKRFAKSYERMTSIDADLDYMDGAGIDMAILSVGYFVSNGLEFCRVCNTGYSRVVRQHPGRFRAMIQVYPFDDVRKNRDEIKRSVEELGLFGLALVSSYGDTTLDANQLDPLYEAAAARIAGNDKTPYRRAIRAILRFDARKRCAAIRAPSLVVAGDRDATVPLSPKLFLRDNIPGAEFVMIPNSGHATPIDQPQKFNDVLMDFVERH